MSLASFTPLLLLDLKLCLYCQLDQLVHRYVGALKSLFGFPDCLETYMAD